MADWYCDEVLDGRRPIGIVAETANVLAFHHTRPSYAVHVVVIPKRHIPSLLDDAATAVLPELLEVARGVAATILEATGACRLVTNLGRYQESSHLHWHVISGALVDPPVEVVPPDDWAPYTGKTPRA